MISESSNCTSRLSETLNLKLLAHAPGDVAVYLWLYPSLPFSSPYLWIFLYTMRIIANRWRRFLIAFIVSLICVYCFRPALNRSLPFVLTLHSLSHSLLLSTNFSQPIFLKLSLLSFSPSLPLPILFILWSPRILFCSVLLWFCRLYSFSLTSSEFFSSSQVPKKFQEITMSSSPLFLSLSFVFWFRFLMSSCLPRNVCNSISSSCSASIVVVLLMTT